MPYGERTSLSGPELRSVSDLPPKPASQSPVSREPASLAELNAIIAAAAPLVAGQAVLGEGPIGAALALVGEQPGDQEERLGRPFVGPAGRLLDRALSDAGIDRAAVYLTNAVKHFKFALRGKRRIHQKPTAGEVARYRPWLMAELEFVAPRVVVALGATALLALSGRALSVGSTRGEAAFEGRRGYVTVHPSYLLRLPDPADQRRAYGQFVDDLAHARALAAEG